MNFSGFTHLFELTCFYDNCCFSLQTVTKVLFVLEFSVSHLLSYGRASEAKFYLNDPWLAGGSGVTLKGVALA